MISVVNLDAAYFIGFKVLPKGGPEFCLASPNLKLDDVYSSCGALHQRAETLYNSDASVAQDFKFVSTVLKCFGAHRYMYMCVKISTFHNFDCLRSLPSEHSKKKRKTMCSVNIKVICNGCGSPHL